MQQDRECWVVAQGRSIIGPVAVWRNPVVGPADLQIWTAKSWPKEMWAIPNNAIICTTRGPGITALGRLRRRHTLCYGQCPSPELLRRNRSCRAGLAHGRGRPRERATICRRQNGLGRDRRPFSGAPVHAACAPNPNTKRAWSGYVVCRAGAGGHQCLREQSKKS